MERFDTEIVAGRTSGEASEILARTTRGLPVRYVVSSPYDAYYAYLAISLNVEREAIIAKADVLGLVYMLL